MTIQEVIDIIQANGPLLKDYFGCDGVKSGDTSVECTGIVSAIVPTIDIIHKAIELNCNLIYVHEPSYYMTPDYPEWRGDFTNTVYNEKRKLLDDHGIVIYRDHDHMHAHKPDGIFWGVIKYLGWEKFYIHEDPSIPFGYIFHLPRTTVGAVAEHLKEKIGLNGMRYIGNADDRISKVAIVAHLYPEAFLPGKEENGYFTDYSTEIIRAMETKGIEAIIPGEVIEWNVLSYIRDAVQQGKTRACFNIGHFSFEQLGMKYAVDWMKEITGSQVPIHYVNTGDIWKFM